MKRQRLVFGRFLPVRRIARGPLGEVFLARDVQSGAARVVRHVEPARASDPLTSSLVQDLRAASEVSDPAVLGAETVDVSPRLGHLVIVREHGEGGDVAALLAKRPRGTLDVGELKIVARALLRGLDALHRRGIAHGRVHARNVIVEAGAGRAWLADAGLARAHGGVATAVDDLARAVELLRRAIPRDEAPTALVELLDDPGAPWTPAAPLLDLVEWHLAHVAVPEPDAEPGRAA